MNLNGFVVVYILANDRVIPAGSNIIIPIYSMNHNPKNFTDPEAFIPERFINERSSETQNPFSYVPFSGNSYYNLLLTLYYNVHFHFFSYSWTTQLHRTKICDV